MTLARRLEHARTFVGQDPVASSLGLEVGELAEGRAVVSLVPQARHLNSLGRVHGSTIYALADQAVAVAANTLPRPALILEMTISFRRAAQPSQRLTATAALRDAGGRTSLWAVEVTGPEGELVALAQGVGYHKGGE